MKVSAFNISGGGSGGLFQRSVFTTTFPPAPIPLSANRFKILDSTFHPLSPKQRQQHRFEKTQTKTKPKLFAENTEPPL